uniref:Uncharacterized protein n=1 Tax=Arundo donax TaxID=35708 RepID=A0A0A8Z6V2_ARUDO
MKIRSCNTQEPKFIHHPALAWDGLRTATHIAPCLHFHRHFE